MDDMCEEFAALREAARQIAAAIAEAITDALDPPRPEIPRPPKCLGPVNKENHTASRPPRRARSSCYKRHR